MKKKPIIPIELKELLEKWEASGRVYFIYPNKGLVSLNGNRLKSYQDALTYLRDMQW